MSLTEVETLTKKYETLQHDVNELRQGVNNLQKSSQRIENCLLSDEDFGQDGLVKKHKELCIKVDFIHVNLNEHFTDAKTEKALKDFKAWLFGILGGVAVTLVFTLINYLLK